MVSAFLKQDLDIRHNTEVKGKVTKSYTVFYMFAGEILVFVDHTVSITTDNL